MKKEWLAVLLLLLFSIPAVKSLFIPGGYTSHDLTHHIIRQISMDKLLSEGQFPPRWSGELNKEYGYPVFLFNYPLPALYGEIFYKLGFNAETAVKAVLFSSMLFSVLGMFLFLRAYLGTSLGAFLGAIFYLYAPHRFLNIYVSAAVGSALAFGIVPFIFWGLTKLKQTQKNIWILLTSLFLALLILSHNVTTFIFSPLILAFGTVLIWQEKDKLKLLKKFVLTILLALGLSSWFWYPALVAKQYIKFDQVYAGFYEEHFPALQQLIKSPWGYGLSHPQNPQEGDLSYQVGLIHILVMLMLIPIIWLRRGIREIRLIGGFALLTFVLAVFLMLKESNFIWGSVPLLPLVQFPWRFSIISVFSASFAAALLIKYLPFRKILFLSLLILVIYANRNHWRINEVFSQSDEYYKSQKTTTATYSEHLPYWGKAMDKEAVAKLEFVRGEKSPVDSSRGEIKFLEVKSHKVVAEVEASESSKLRLNQFYFPGWEVKVNEKKVDFNYLVEGESYGMPIFDIEKGRSQIKAEFKNTSDRAWADRIAFITVIVWVMWLGRLLIPRFSKRS